MPTPSLLLKPEGSRDLNGDLNVTLNTGVSLTSGQYGQAWTIAEDRNQYFSFSELPTNKNMTILIRMKRPTIYSEFYLYGGWGGGDASYPGDTYYGYFTDEPHYAYINTENDYNQWQWETAGTSEWLTLAIVYTQEDVAVYDNGVIQVRQDFDRVDNLMTPEHLEIYEYSTIESFAIFSNEVDEANIKRLSELEETWTWENLTFTQQGRSRVEIPAPTLLLSPHESRDSNGGVDLSLNGSTRVVDGKYGQSWFLEEETTNLVPNPSYENGAGGWVTGKFGGVSEASTHGLNTDPEESQFGTNSYRFTIATEDNTGGGSVKFYHYLQCPVSGLDGQTVTASVYAHSHNNSIGAQILVDFINASNVTLKTAAYTYNNSILGWVRLSVSDVVPVGTTKINVSVRIRSLFPYTGGDIWFDGWQLEAKPYASSYCDGSLGSGYSWNGAAHASSSSRANGYIDVNVDPNTVLNPNKGTMLARFRKRYDDPNNSYIAWIGNYGVDDWTGMNTTGMEWYVPWRAGDAVVKSNSPRPPITANRHHTGVQRWEGTNFDWRLENSDWDSTTRDEPVGRFDNDFRLGQASFITLNGEIESLVFYDEVLTDEQVEYLMTMRGSWTWTNLSPVERVVQRTPTASSLDLIPRLYLADRHNVLGEEITDYVRKGVVEYNPDRAIKFSFRASMSDSTVVRPYVDFIAPFLTVVYPDGHEVTSQMGLYGVVPPSQTINQQSERVEVDGRDLTWLLSLDVFDQGYDVAAGTSVVAAVESVLLGAGFTRFNIQSSDRTITNARSWKPGTTKLKVINDILTGAGYYSLTCGKDGTFISIPYVSIVNPTVVVEYDTTQPSYVSLIKDVKKDTTQDRVANKIVVIKDNANEAPIVVTKVNTNPNSPTSIPNLGMTIAKVVTDSNITDAAAAEVVATRHLEEASQQYNKITLYTTPDVERDINEVYRLNVVNALGEVVADGLWRARGWKLDFDARSMQHDLSNIDEPPMDVA